MENILASTSQGKSAISETLPQVDELTFLNVDTALLEYCLLCVLVKQSSENHRIFPSFLRT